MLDAVTVLQRSGGPFLRNAPVGSTIGMEHPFSPQRFAEEALAALQVSRRIRRFKECRMR
jgi:hypothetical protein